VGVGENRNRLGSRIKSDVYTIMDRLITGMHVAGLNSFFFVTAFSHPLYFFDDNLFECTDDSGVELFAGFGDDLLKRL